MLTVSMVSHADVFMYLLSVKSFYRYVGRGQVTILDDGSLTDFDKDVLREHIRGCRIVRAQDVETHPCPSYISWRRLLYIADAVQGSYVVQLDSDLLSLGDLPEVREAAEANTSFVLGTWRNQEIEPAVSLARRSRDRAGHVQHVQAAAERSLDALPNPESLRYVRGCAGFSGFARGSFDRSDVENFSKNMREILGAQWENWGSEQTTTNYIVANSESATVLPFPKYAGFRPREHQQSVFVHFSGIHRFEDGVYERLARRTIGELRGGPDDRQPEYG